MLDDEEQEASELERLCHVGAAELLMPLEEFSLEAAPDWSLRRAEELAAVFGASLEATVYRLATAYPGVAIAGSAFFRHTKGDQCKAGRLSLKQPKHFVYWVAGLHHSHCAASEIPTAIPAFLRNVPKEADHPMEQVVRRQFLRL